MTEEEKYLKWYETEKKKGLQDVRFFPGDLSKVSKEGFFQELNSINEAVGTRGIVVGEWKAGG